MLDVLHVTHHLPVQQCPAIATLRICIQYNDTWVGVQSELNEWSPVSCQALQGLSAVRCLHLHQKKRHHQLWLLAESPPLADVPPQAACQALFLLQDRSLLLSLSLLQILSLLQGLSLLQLLFLLQGLQRSHCHLPTKN